VELAEAGPVDVAVFDALGRRVATLHAGPLPAGTHAFAWKEGALPGVYFVRAAGLSHSATLALTLIR
jgi:hypothetical protein